MTAAAKRQRIARRTRSKTAGRRMRRLSTVMLQFAGSGRTLGAAFKKATHEMRRFVATLDRGR